MRYQAHTEIPGQIVTFLQVWYNICLHACMRKIYSVLIATAFLICFSLSATYVHAQARGPVTPMRVGSTTLSLGFGVGGDYRGKYYDDAFGTKLAMEWGLWQAGPGVITLGFGVGGSVSNHGPHDDYHARTIIANMRSAWHYGWDVKGLDTYGGFSAGVGFYREKYKDYDDSDTDAFPVFGGFVGASYFVSPQFGFNAEAGFDITNFQVGVIFKLK